LRAVERAKERKEKDRVGLGLGLGKRSTYDPRRARCAVNGLWNHYGLPTFSTLLLLSLVADCARKGRQGINAASGKRDAEKLLSWDLAWPSMA
jgi:hypothetical protein